MTAYQQAQLFAAQESNEVPADRISISDSDAPSALTQTDLIDQLIGSYRQREHAILETAEHIRHAISQGVMDYFLEGMRLVHGPDLRCAVPTDADAAKAALRAEFWNRLLSQTQIFEAMPAKKRVEARKQFSGLECPPFDESTVRPTIETLLAQRADFFSERVDNIFQGLSKSHVTNAPHGFSKKLILANVFDKLGFTSSYKIGLISDLRGVVGRLTRRGEPTEYATRQLFDRLYASKIGQKVAIDGGAFFVTVYRAGTVHFEVAQEVAVELNCILAARYPHAIPSKFRTAPKKRQAQSFDLKMERLSMGAIAIIADMRFYKAMQGSSSIFSKASCDVAKAIEVLESLGATVRLSPSKNDLYAEFDYDPSEVIEQIIFSGVVPEKVSYQFYATKGSIGAEAARRLDAQPGMKCCEPSAGTGDLAGFLPQESTLCIELAPVRAKVLEAKGFKTIKADFLEWASENPAVRFDRILMNPPFSKGRAKAHLIAAAGMLKDGGRLVAILPASMINTSPLDGFDHEWSEVFEDQFEGAAVRVAILTANAPAKGAQL